MRGTTKTNQENDIKDMNDLRLTALDTIQRLRNGDIDISEAQTMAKLCDSVISTVNTQFTYAKLIGQAPMIPFMDSAHEQKLIEGEKINSEESIRKRLDYK